MGGTSPVPAATILTLDRDACARAATLALRESRRYAGSSGAYGNDNATRDHLTGKLGEVAVEAWCRSRGASVDAAFASENRQGEADLTVQWSGSAPLRVEVKARGRWWVHDDPEVRPWEEQLAASQLHSIEALSDVIVRAAVRVHAHRGPFEKFWSALEAGGSPAFGPAVVALRGWVSVCDLATYGEALWESGFRPVLRVPASRLRPMGALSSAAPDGLAGGPAWRRSQDRTEPVCGHAGFHQHCWACAPGPSWKRYPGSAGKMPSLRVPTQVMVAGHTFHRMGAVTDIRLSSGTGEEAWPADGSGVVVGSAHGRTIFGVQEMGIDEAALTATGCRFCFPRDTTVDR